jgi:hypothetical protein
MSQDSETPEQPETPETPAEPTPPATPPPAEPPAMQPPTTPPVAQPAAPVAGAPALKPGQGGLAIAAFVCGLGGIFTSWCCIGLPLAIAAVVCGILGKKDAEKRGASNWMWITGLTLGIVSLVIFVIVVIVSGLNTDFNTTEFNIN